MAVEMSEVEGMAEVKSIRGVDKSLLELFWKLAETAPEVRIAAASSMMRLLHHKQAMIVKDTADTVCPELKYSVERLIKGMSSYRKAARPGYAIALTEILKLFPTATIKEVLSLMDKHLLLSNKQEKCQMVIGQFLSYSAIIRSGRLKDDLESLPTIVLQLYLLAFGRCYIQETTYKLMSYLFTEIPEENFKECVWPKMKKKLSCGWEACSPDILWFLLLCLRMYPNTVSPKFLTKNWGCEDILSKENFEYLQKIVKKSTSVHPQFSPVCSELLHFMLQKKKAKKYWNVLFDETLFKSDQNEKTFLGFKVVKAALSMTISEKLVSSILSPNFSSVLTRCLLSCKHPMHPVASELANFLGNYVKESNDPHVQIAVLKAFIQPPGTMLLEQMLNKKEVCVIINNLSYEAVRLYYDVLQCLILQKPSNEEEDEEHMNWKRRQAISQIGNLVSHLAVVADTDWRLQVTKFLFLHSFFEIKEATEDIDPKWIPHCDSEGHSLHPSVRLVCMHTFNRALDSLNRRMENSISHSTPDTQVSILKCVADFADKLLKSSDKITPLQPLEKIQEPWNNMLKTIMKLTKQCKKDGKTAETAAFQVLFLQLGLQLFSDEENIPTILEELQVCCKEKMKNRNTEGSDEWIRVIVDVMLSLLSAESHHMRRIVTFFFSVITPFVTQEAIEQILDIINPEKATQEEILVAGSEDEDEDDVEFSSGSSSEDCEMDDGESQKNEKNEEEVTALKLKVQEALGAAADVSDAESEGVLTDSEMTQLDEALSDAFRRQKKAGHLQFSSAQQTLMHFRMKCLDLISIYLKSEPPMTLVLQCILPILSAYQYGLQNRHQKPLSQKACSALKLLVKTKKFKDCNGVECDEIRKLMKHMIDITNKVSNASVSGKLLNSLCIYMVLCERKLESSSQEKSKKSKKSALPSCMDQIKTALNAFVKEIPCCLTPHLFVSLMNACPETAWSFVRFLQDSAFDPKVRLFKRAQCLGLLVSSFRFAKGQKDITSEMWLDVFETIVPKAVEVLSSMLHSKLNIKPMYTAELLEVLLAIIELNKQKCSEASVFRNKETLVEVLTELYGVHKKRLTQQGKRSLKKLIRLLGGEVPVMNQLEKKRKTPENEENGDAENVKKIKLMGNDDSSKNVELSKSEKVDDVSSTSSEEEKDAEMEDRS